MSIVDALSPLLLNTKQSRDLAFLIVVAASDRSWELLGALIPQTIYTEISLDISIGI